jgi:hypothetical protein
MLTQLNDTRQMRTRGARPLASQPQLIRKTSIVHGVAACMVSAMVALLVTASGRAEPRQTIGVACGLGCTYQALYAVNPSSNPCHNFACYVANVCPLADEYGNCEPYCYGPCKVTGTSCSTTASGSVHVVCATTAAVTNCNLLTNGSTIVRRMRYQCVQNEQGCQCLITTTGQWVLGDCPCAVPAGGVLPHNPCYKP